MSDSIDKMSKQFSNLNELQTYADAQYITIVSLNRKINELENKNKSLEAMLSSGTPIVKENSSDIQLLSQGSDEETICRLQLKLFKDKVLSGDELTLEETKRVEIYAKLLIAIRAGDKKGEEQLTSLLDDSQLLDFLKETKK